MNGLGLPGGPDAHLTLFGIKATPASLVDAAGNCLTLQTVDNHQIEHLACAACVQMGGRAAMAGYAMTGQQLILVMRSSMCLSRKKGLNSANLQPIFSPATGFTVKSKVFL